jgi:hypothetical protein
MASILRGAQTLQVTTRTNVPTHEHARGVWTHPPLIITDMFCGEHQSVSSMHVIIADEPSAVLGPWTALLEICAVTREVGEGACGAYFPKKQEARVNGLNLVCEL